MGRLIIDQKWNFNVKEVWVVEGKGFNLKINRFQGFFYIFFFERVIVYIVPLMRGARKGSFFNAKIKVKRFWPAQCICPSLLFGGFQGFVHIFIFKGVRFSTFLNLKVVRTAQKKSCPKTLALCTPKFKMGDKTFSDVILVMAWFFSPLLFLAFWGFWGLGAPGSVLRCWPARFGSGQI